MNEGEAVAGLQDEVQRIWLKQNLELGRKFVKSAVHSEGINFIIS